MNTDTLKTLVVMGDPVEHSLSPAMHNAALKELGLQKEFFYDKLLVKKEELESFIQRIRSKDVHGASVTLPHKVSIIPFLDKLTEEAELIGAVNTVYLEGNSVVGHNTDGIGCLKALKEEDVFVEGKKIVILGSGGAARAIAFVFALNKAGHIIILNRTIENAKELAEDVSQKTSVDVKAGNLEGLRDVLKDADILINCTPIGMEGKDEERTLVESDQMHKGLTVMDTVYTPQKTVLLREAEKAGCKIVYGLGMLVHQGAEQFKIFTGKDPDTDVMRAALLMKLKSNIALIGFMAAGKTKIGRKLAKKCNMDFVETDDLIVERVGKSISEIFEQDGEEYFRKIESEIINDIGNRENTVISCGGGVVLKKENVDNLKKSSIIIRFNVSPETVLRRTEGDENRPLLQTDDKFGKIKELMDEREQFYESAADYTIDNSEIEFDEVIEKVLVLLS